MKIVGPIPDHILRLMPKADRPSGVLTFKEIGEKREDRAEKTLQNNIANLLRQRGIVFNYSRMDRRKTDVTGWPDFTFAVNGRACAVEVKRPDQVPTPDQFAVMSAMIENGWMTAVVHSEAEFIKFMDFVAAKHWAMPAV